MDTLFEAAALLCDPVKQRWQIRFGNVRIYNFAQNKNILHYIFQDVPIPYLDGYGFRTRLNNGEAYDFPPGIFMFEKRPAVIPYNHRDPELEWVLYLPTNTTV